MLQLLSVSRWAGIFERKFTHFSRPTKLCLVKIFERKQFTHFLRPILSCVCMRVQNSMSSNYLPRQNTDCKHGLFRQALNGCKLWTIPSLYYCASNTTNPTSWLVKFDVLSCYTETKSRWIFPDNHREWGE